MGRSPCCCHDAGVKKGPWTEEEDKTLVEHIQKRGGNIGSWRGLPMAAGLNRCGKSCRLRWTNYLRPDIKRGNFSDDEERLIITLHAGLGNKWATIATHLEGRTDNEIKNYWNTHIRKKLLRMGVDPVTHQQLPPNQSHLGGGLLPEGAAAAASLGGLDTGALRQARLLQYLLQSMGSNSGATNLIANLAAANAVLNSSSSIAQNLLFHQDQMNYLQPGNTASFAEQEVMQQQLLYDTSPGTSSFAGGEPAAELGNTIVAFTSHDAAPVTVTDCPPQEFTSLLEPISELPGLCSLETELFWKDLLEDSYFLQIPPSG